MEENMSKMIWGLPPAPNDEYQRFKGKTCAQIQFDNRQRELVSAITDTNSFFFLLGRPERIDDARKLFAVGNVYLDVKDRFGKTALDTVTEYSLHLPYAATGMKALVENAIASEAPKRLLASGLIHSSTRERYKPA